MNTNKKAIKSGVVYAIATIINAILVLVTTPYFTRFMTPEAFGEYNNFLSWYNILSVFSLNLSSTLISARDDFKNEIQSYIYSMTILNFIMSGSLLFILISFSKFFNRISGLSNVYIILMCIYIAFYQVFQIYQANERFNFHYKLSAWLIIACAIVSSIISIILVQTMENQMLARVLGLIVPTVLIGVFNEVLFINNNRKIQIKYWNYALPICIPYIPHLLSLTLLNSLDKTMISNLVGNKETAIYSVAYTCGSTISIIVGILNNAYVPWMAEKLRNNEDNALRNFSKYYVILFQIILLGILLVSPEIVFILGGSNYLDAVNIIPAIMVGCSMQLIYTMYVNIEQYYKNTKWMALISALAALTNGLLNYILIPHMGYQIASITTLISYIILALGHILIVKKMGYERYYNTRICALSLLVDIALVFICYFLYHNIVIRVFAISAYAFALIYGIYKEKNMLLNFMKKR